MFSLKSGSTICFLRLHSSMNSLLLTKQGKRTGEGSGKTLINDRTWPPIVPKGETIFHRVGIGILHLWWCAQSEVVNCATQAKSQILHAICDFRSDILFSTGWRLTGIS